MLNILPNFNFLSKLPKTIRIITHLFAQFSSREGLMRIIDCGVKGAGEMRSADCCPGEEDVGGLFCSEIRIHLS